MSPQESAWLSRAVGEVKHAHTHPSHPEVVAFKQGRKWYELPKSEFKALIRTGRDIEREELRERKHQVAELRAIEEFRRAEASEQKRAAHRAEIERNREQRYNLAQERAVRSVQRAERAEVVKLLREVGGVRLQSAGDRGEYELLPKEVRRKNGRLTMDSARERIMEEMPWLNLETPDDMVQYFERTRVTRMQQGHQAALRRRVGAA